MRRMLIRPERIKLLEILQEVRTIYKTRNQLMVKRRVQTRLERKRTGPQEWLVVTRRPLSDDSTSEGNSSPDATEQDGRYRYRYVRRESTVEECGKHHRVYRYPMSPWSSALQTTLEGEQHAPERHHAGEASPQEVVLG
jgi:hypothetical protein